MGYKCEKCGFCAYHIRDMKSREWICDNEQSENYCLETDYEDG